MNFSKELTTEYLGQYPDEASRYCKTREKQILNIEKHFSKEISPKDRTTKPDYLTSKMLESVYNHKELERDRIQEHYNDQKQAEMMIGELLERYIYSKGKKYGWAFTGSCIKSVDFIKKDKKGKWTTLQVKNSDNTENSSSSKVRDATTIQKWVRRNSKKGTTLWAKFPDPELQKQLTEKGFFEFTKNHFSDSWNTP